jgi:hypothetical protein
MKTILVILAMLVAIPANANETFGLGSASPEPMALSSAETFGLTDGVVVVRQRIVVEQKRQPVTPVRSLLPVVRRAAGNWIDEGIGAWNETKLAAHLRGELASANHRGAVPVQQLVGRTLKELRDIHDNLHEGWLWDGSARVRAAVTVRQASTYWQASSCPGGVCPTPTRGRLFRR